MKKITLAISALIPIISFGHPGHGETEGYSIIHYFTEPVHAIVTISVLALAYIAARIIRRKKA